MALEMFLKMDGVTGGTRNYQHRGWSDMLSWNWSLNRVGAGGQPSSDDVTDMNEISVVKAIGIDSPALMTLFAERTPIKTVEISVMPVVGKREAQLKYLAIMLEDVLITSISTDGNAEDSFFKETITLVFGKVKYEYYQHTAADPSGGAAGAATTVENFTFGWDAAANTAC